MVGINKLSTSAAQSDTGRCSPYGSDCVPCSKSPVGTGWWLEAVGSREEPSVGDEAARASDASAQSAQGHHPGPRVRQGHRTMYQKCGRVSAAPSFVDEAQLRHVGHSALLRLDSMCRGTEVVEDKGE